MLSSRALSGFCFLLLALALCGSLVAAEEKGPVQKALEKKAAEEKKSDKNKAVTPIPIAELKRTSEVNFGNEILPLLRRNCQACHNAKDKENDLVLESPQTILKGGDSGPAVIPGKGQESLLLQLSAHQMQPIMPPEKNERKAVPFTSEELALIKLWINQGAKGNATPLATVHWRPVPQVVNPIYAVAITRDGQYAACGRANQIYVYHLPTGQLAAQLIDPSLTRSGVTLPGADLDLIQSLAFHPDGDLLASGSYRTVKLWRHPKNVKLAEFANDSAIKSVAVSPDGKFAALGDAAGKIKLVDCVTGKELRSLAGHTAPVTGVEFTSDGTNVVSGSQDKSLCVWNSGDGQLLGKLETTTPVNAIALLPNALVAVAQTDSIIRIWSLPGNPQGEAPAPSKELKGHTGPVTSLDFAANLLASGSEDGTVRLWNIENAQLIKALNHGTPVTGVAVRKDGRRLASASVANSVKLWNLENGQQLAEKKGDSRLQVRVASQERNLTVLKSQLADQRRTVTENQERVKKEEAAVTKAEQAKTAAEKMVSDKTEAAKKAVAAKQGVEKEIQDATHELQFAQAKLVTAQAALDKEKKNQELMKAREEANQVVVALDAKVKASQKKLPDVTKGAETSLQEQKTAETDLHTVARGLEVAQASAKQAQENAVQGTAGVTALETQVKQTESELQAAHKLAADSEKPFRTVAFTPDGSQFYAAGDDHFIHAYEGDYGEPGSVIEGHHDSVAALTTTPSGVLSGGADNKAIYWNSNPPWSLERTIGGPDPASPLVDRVLSLDFSPDGKTLATSGGEPSRSGELKLWTVTDGSLKREIKDPDSDTIFCVRFSPDGNFLATGAADRFMKVFDANDGHLVHSFEGHTHHVLCLAWRADGKWLVSGSADNGVKVWDVATGEQKRTIAGFNKEITSLSFAGVGSEAVVGCGDKTLKLYNLETGEVARMYDNFSDFVDAVAISADGKRIVAGGQEGVLREFRIDKTPAVKTLVPPKK